MQRLIFALPLIAASLAASQSFAADLIKNYGGNNYTFIEYNYIGVPGRLYIPDGYDPNTPTPLVMFYHGTGEGHNNNTGSPSYNTAQVNTAVSNLTIQANAQNYLLFVPQSVNGWWGETGRLVKTLGKLSTEYNIDPTRLYLTGLSGGGYGTVYALRDHSDLFAGYVPVSMTGDQENNPAFINNAINAPTWYFVGGDDAFFRNETREHLNPTLAALGVTGPGLPVYPNDPQTNYNYVSPIGNLRYTEIANGTHSNNTWNNGAYNPANGMYNWLFAQQTGTKRPDAGDTVYLSFTNSNQIPKVDSSGRNWNTPVFDSGYQPVNNPGVFHTFARDEHGDRTTVTYELTDGFSPFYHTTALPGTQPYDAFVSNGYWQLDTNNDTAAQIVIHGLMPGGTYDVEIFASINSTDQNNYVGKYTANGEMTTINAAGNITLSTIADVIADAQGRITLDITQNGNSRWAVINTLAITAVPEPASLALLGGAVLLLTRRRG